MFKILSLFLILCSFPLYGDQFKSPYVTFDIGYNWTCKSFGINWVCHHYQHKGAKPALMLITAREGLQADDLNIYIQTFEKEEKQAVNSQKIHIKKVLVNRHTWVDSFYKNSVVKNVYSRYTATVCCKETKVRIHVLIGFHAHKGVYAKYAREFLRSIKSLRLSNDLKQTLSQISGQTDEQKKNMNSYIESILFEIGGEGNNNKRGYSLLPYLLLAGLISGLFFLSFYFFYYKKKIKKQKLKKTKAQRARRKSRRRKKTPRQ